MVDVLKSPGRINFALVTILNARGHLIQMRRDN